MAIVNNANTTIVGDQENYNLTEKQLSDTIGEIVNILPIQIVSCYYLVYCESSWAGVLTQTNTLFKDKKEAIEYAIESNETGEYSLVGEYKVMELNCS
jgi:hypothetical protein